MGKIFRFIFKTIFHPHQQKMRSEESRYENKVLENIPDVGSVCPYCGAAFATKPKARCKCRACQKTISVRKGKLLTQEQALAADEERIRMSERSLIANDLEKFGLDLKDYKELESESLRTECLPLSRPEIVHKLAWAKFAKITAQKDLSGRSPDYYTLALYDRDNGLDFLPARIEASRQELLRYMDDEFISRVSIITSGESSCPNCRKLDGQIYSIKDALKIMPLPVINCTNKEFDNFCRCSYTPEVD
jgi:transposase-like protein